MSADFSATSTIDLAATPDFAIGSLRVRPCVREVQGAGAPERLEPRVMQAMVVLGQRPGEVVSREGLLEQCWDGRIVGDDAINRCIAKLKRVGAAHDAFSVEAIPRVGYRLVVVPSPPAAESGPSPVAKRRWLWPVVAAALALAAIAAIILQRASPEPLSVRTPYVVTAFSSVKDDPSLKAFAATTISEINAALARQRLPTVSAGGSRIEVSAIVTSDTGRTHARVSLVAQPMSTTLWSLEFEAPAAEEAALRAQIASRVAAVAQMANEFLEYPSADFDAVTLSMMIKSADDVLGNTWTILSGAEDAVRRSPNYAAGHAAYATNLLAAAVYGSPDQTDALRARAAAEAKRAIELEPRVPDLSVAIWLMDATDWAARMKALSNSPVADSAWAALGRGAFLTMAGRAIEASVQVSAGMDRYGGRPSVPLALIDLQRVTGRTEEAVASARRYLAARPTNQGMRGELLDLTTLWGDPDEVLALLGDAGRRPAGPTLWLDAHRRFAVWRKTGAAADRLAASRAIVAAAQRGLHPQSTVPLMARLGDTNAAFDLAEAWAENPRTRYSGMLFDTSFLYFPETAAMRRDPRFVSLASKLGLLKFWRDTGVWPDFCRTEPESVCDQIKQGR